MEQHLNKSDIGSPETIKKLFQIEADTLKSKLGSSFIDPKDILWLLELNNVLYTTLVGCQQNLTKARLCNCGQAYIKLCYICDNDE